MDVGIGKYHNRNVIDMFAGISRGKEQLTVRASRQLDADPERVGVGPLDYEVLEPLRKVRFVLQENDIVPIRFDLTITGVLPPFLEQKDSQREPQGFRVQSDLLRYHQASTVSGEIWMDGKRIEVRDEEWFGFRDHSWGVRMDVGEPAPDVFKHQRLDSNFLLTWSPMWLQRPDGTSYEIHHYLQWVDGAVTYFSGFENLPRRHATSAAGTAGRVEVRSRQSATARRHADLRRGVGRDPHDRDRTGQRHRVPPRYWAVFRFQGPTARTVAWGRASGR